MKVNSCPTCGADAEPVDWGGRTHEVICRGPKFHNGGVSAFSPLAGEDEDWRKKFDEARAYVVDAWNQLEKGTALSETFARS